MTTVSHNVNMPDILRLPQIASTYSIIYTGIFRVAGHKFGEVDHTGGLVKVTIRKGVAAEQTFLNAADTIDSFKTNLGIISLHVIILRRSKLQN